VDQDYTLLTSRWAKVSAFEKSGQPPGFVPVRTSLGGPRFMPSAKMFPAVHELMPYGLLKPSLPEDVFKLKYREWLTKHGVFKIHEQFVKLHQEYGGKPLVLLCFEDVEAGQYCHRVTFAEWWLETTGAPVLEVANLPVAGVEPIPAEGSS
jgi:hypothetical protein